MNLPNTYKLNYDFWNIIKKSLAVDPETRCHNVGLDLNLLSKVLITRLVYRERAATWEARCSV